MAKSVVESEAVKRAIKEISGREPYAVLSRGNYPAGTFEVWFGPTNADMQMITVPSEVLERYRKQVRAERKAKRA